MSAEAPASSLLATESTAVVLVTGLGAEAAGVVTTGGVPARAAIAPGAIAVP